MPSVGEIEESRLAIIGRLPRHSRWAVRETHVAWDFSRAVGPLRPLTGDDVVNPARSLIDGYRDILLFGEEDVADGGGASPFIGIHTMTGEVVGLDFEREQSPVFLFNSSVWAFIDTFLVLEQTLKSDSSIPRDLRRRGHAIDSGAFPKSEWNDLIDLLLDDAREEGA